LGLALGATVLTDSNPSSRSIADIRKAGAAWITETELESLCDQVEGYRRALVAHHDLATLSDEVIHEYDGRECPVCRRARAWV
jgi:hypothetical protein